MAFTKTGSAYTSALKQSGRVLSNSKGSLDGIGREALYGPIPLMMGGLEVSSGQASVGNALGASIGGGAGAATGAGLASKVTKYLPGRWKTLGKGVNLLAGLTGGMLGVKPGANAGSKIPIWKRKPSQKLTSGMNFNKPTNTVID